MEGGRRTGKEGGGQMTWGRINFLGLKFFEISLDGFPLGILGFFVIKGRVNLKI